MAIKEDCERVGITLPGLSAAYNFLIMHKNGKQIPGKGVPNFLSEINSEVHMSLSGLIKNV